MKILISNDKILCLEKEFTLLDKIFKHYFWNLSIRHKCFRFFSKLDPIKTWQTMKTFPTISALCTSEVAKKRYPRHALLQPAFGMQKPTTYRVFGIFVFSFIYCSWRQFHRSSQVPLMEIPQFIKRIRVLREDSVFKSLQEFTLQTAIFWGKCILFSPSVLLTLLSMLLNSPQIDAWQGARLLPQINVLKLEHTSILWRVIFFLWEFAVYYAVANLTSLKKKQNLSAVQEQGGREGHNASSTFFFMISLSGWQWLRTKQGTPPRKHSQKYWILLRATTAELGTWPQLSILKWEQTRRKIRHLLEVHVFTLYCTHFSDTSFTSSSFLKHTGVLSLSYTTVSVLGIARTFYLIGISWSCHHFPTVTATLSHSGGQSLSPHLISIYPWMIKMTFHTYTIKIFKRTNRHLKI